MSALYSCVHHEMLGPLNSLEEAAVCLVMGITDPYLLGLAKVA